MQISASTLLASQQAAPVHAKPAAGFAHALEKTGGFQPLPLKQAAAAQEAAPTNFLQSAPKGPQKLGSAIDIKV